MRPLERGDTIGVVAPAFAADSSVYDVACDKLQNLGFGVKFFGIPSEPFGRMSAPDSVRAEALHKAFRDPTVGAILCGRGGYGSGRLADHLDTDLIAAHPKPFVGYSDITNLLVLLENEANLVGFHGPMLSDLASKGDEWSWHNLLGILQGQITQYEMDSSNFTMLVPGCGQGRLVGGNISILCAMAGAGLTPPDGDVIVFLEDVGEFMFRLDRSLVQLSRLGLFERARGIMIADMQLKDRGDDNSLGLSLETVLGEHFGTLGIPVGIDLPCGHTHRQMTLPVGADCVLNLSQERCSIEFAGVWDNCCQHHAA